MADIHGKVVAPHKVLLLLQLLHAQEQRDTAVGFTGRFYILHLIILLQLLFSCGTLACFVLRQMFYNPNSSSCLLSSHGPGGKLDAWSSWGLYQLLFTHSPQTHTHIHSISRWWSSRKSDLTWALHTRTDERTGPKEICASAISFVFFFSKVALDSDFHAAYYDSNRGRRNSRCPFQLNSQTKF